MATGEYFVYFASMAQDTNETDSRWTHVGSITAIGEPLLELRPTSSGRIEIAYGGDVANSLVCVSRLLRPTNMNLALVTSLGGSSYGKWLRTKLQGRGIEVREPPGTPGMEPGIYGIPLTEIPGIRFSYWRNQSAARQFLQTATINDFERLIGKTDLLIVTGITLALCSDPTAEALSQWLTRHQHECALVLDTNYRPALWPSAGAAQTRITHFEDRAAISATSLDDEMALRNAQTSVTDVAARLGDPAREVLIRNGADGCYLRLDHLTRRVPAIPATVIDTAGAGDAHLAAYVAARTKGMPPVAAATFANSIAAAVVSQRGSVLQEHTVLPTL